MFQLPDINGLIQVTNDLRQDLAKYDQQVQQISTTMKDLREIQGSLIQATNALTGAVQTLTQVMKKR
ncbi:hypothetical protein LCGC14_0999170 [marine sediment metagenome]|uniref:Uncharacterized protein n=1 Tax=marine sediment metagenome TaxID=412755 RepID=A0A0F9N898_9ZZZZ